MKNKLVLILIALTIVIMSTYLINYSLNNKLKDINTDNIILKENKIDLNSMTLKQKIAQMIVVRGDKEDLDFTKLNIGGIFLDRQDSKEDYKNLIQKYQDNSKIKLLVSTDLEGAWTPFSNPESHQIFPKFSEIKTSQEAKEVGLRHGELLKEIGFNINFAPVAEYSDKVYGGRTFSGSKEEIAEKIKEYIIGLQKNVLGTCKHYPGNSMEKNLHHETDEQLISKDDLYLFEICQENNISSIMVSHQIATGELNSNGKPSTVSSKVISTINNSTLIIADEINMKGLKNFYPDKTKLYIDLINSGENLILDFDLNSKELYNLIEKIELEIKKGKIDKNKIDNSVRKILKLKGYEVV